ncbi:MAG TPA: hypothetical protein VMZ73_10740, partial [Acidimicrobiales bacterium]|nr:hypothetical protein [Acidimicrobiales bacterium]
MTIAIRGAFVGDGVGVVTGGGVTGGAATVTVACAVSVSVVLPVSAVTVTVLVVVTVTFLVHVYVQVSVPSRMLLVFVSPLMRTAGVHVLS